MIIYLPKITHFKDYDECIEVINGFKLEPLITAIIESISKMFSHVIYVEKIINNKVIHIKPKSNN